VDNLLYFGGTINSEEKNDGEINTRIQNSSKFYHIIKSILWNEQLQKQRTTSTYKAYYELILTSKTEIWTLTMRNKSKIEAMDTKFLEVLEENKEG
jgi:hypothetical protein